MIARNLDFFIRVALKGSIIIAYFLFWKDTPTLGSAQLSSISHLLSHVQ